MLLINDMWTLHEDGSGMSIDECQQHQSVSIYFNLVVNLMIASYSMYIDDE